MNQFFLETRVKEKVDDLLKEGMMSQAYYRSGASKTSFLSRLPKLILVVLVISGLILVILR
jgi:hypothetical protein